MSLHTSMDHVQMNYDPKVIPLNLRRKSKMIVMSVSTEPVATLINTQFFHFRKFDRSKNRASPAVALFTHDVAPGKLQH
jgi:hypothetical protein